MRDNTTLKSLIAIRTYLTGAHNVDRVTPDAERIELALAEIEKALPTKVWLHTCPFCQTNWDAEVNTCPECGAVEYEPEKWMRKGKIA